MSCKCRQLKARLIERFYSVIMSTKKYSTDLINKHFCITGSQKEHNITCSKKTYGVSYCISYRPLNINERILARGRWNDKGIWTPDGIFNDGKI